MKRRTRILVALLGAILITLGLTIGMSVFWEWVKTG